QVGMVRNLISSAPDNHFAPCPHGAVGPSRHRRIDCAGSCPGVRAGIVAPASVKIAVSVVVPTPNDHLAAGPDCALIGSGERRVGRAGSGPSVVGRVVPTPSIQKVRTITSCP